MAEDIENKINQIKELIGKDGMADSLKNLMNAFGKQNQSQNTSEETNNKSQESSIPFDPDTLQMFFKMKQVLDSARNNDDPREKLLFALKPYLSTKRQDKIGDILKILKMANILDVVSKIEGSERNAKS